MIGVGGLWTRWQRFLALLALALFGQASALAMLQVPNYEVIQHYLSWRVLLSTTNAVWLVAPVLQTILAVLGLYRSRATFITFVRHVITLPVLVLLFGITAFASAYPNWIIALYIGEVVLAVWIILANLFNLILAAAAMPSDLLLRADGWIKTTLASLSGIKLLPWVLALWVTVVSAALCWFVLDRVPHIPDDVGYLFQAKYFSLGRLYAAAPTDPAAFEINNLYSDGTSWWSYGFPAWPAALSLGVLVGVPWLVNPVLGGLTILLSWWLLLRVYGRFTAQMVVVLLALSPWFLFMSASFMPHPLSLVWTLIGLIGLEQARRSERGRWGLITGAALGGLLLTRPLEAVALSVAFGIWVLTFKGWKPILRTLTGIAATGLLVGGLIFPYNYALTGNVFITPHQKYADTHYSYVGADRMGFGADVGNVGWTNLDPIPGHGFIDIIINGHQNTYYSGFELFGWGFGSLVFAASFVLWRNWRREDLMFLLIPFVIIGIHSFYWFSGGPDFGARYWYQILIPLVVLTVRGIQELQCRWAKSGADSLNAVRVAGFVALATLVAFTNFMPWRSLGKYYRYRGMSADIARLATKCEFQRDLVFIEDEEDYSAAFVWNPPSLDSAQTIYARYPGMERIATVSQKFPDRSVRIVTGSLSRPETVKVKTISGANVKPSCPQ